MFNLSPKKYFVSFPCGVYDPRAAMKSRSEISCNKRNFYFSYNGETVRDGHQLGFSFFPNEWKEIRYSLKMNCTGGDKNLPFQERWSSRNFSLDKIFKNDNIVIEKSKEVSCFSEIRDWKSYVDCTGLNLRKDPERKIVNKMKYKGNLHD